MYSIESSPFTTQSYAGSQVRTSVVSVILAQFPLFFFFFLMTRPPPISPLSPPPPLSRSRACAAGRAPVVLAHSAPHTDRAPGFWGVEAPRGPPLSRLAGGGVAAPRRYVQIGLRGYWPGE